MLRFEARLLVPESRAVAVRQVSAPDEATARTMLTAGGASVLSLELTRQPPRQTAFNASGELALWCRELKALLHAGLSVVEALDALSAGPGAASVNAALLGRLQVGKPLSTAMQDVGGFPPLLVASVRASERTSDLPHALDAYIRFDDMAVGLRRKVVSAAMYPGLVVMLGSVVALFLLLVVIPRFARLYGEIGTEVSFATHTLLTFSSTLATNPALAPMAFATLVAGVIWGLRSGRPRRAADWLTSAWPWLGRQFAHFSRARLFEALALLVHGGYSLHDALGVLMTLAPSTDLTRRLGVARLRIEEGASVSASFHHAGLTDPVTDRLVRAGERGGDFDKVLWAIADRHRVAFETFVERATRIVEPVLLLAVATMVGGMVVLLYMPVFDIAASVR